MDQKQYHVPKLSVGTWYKFRVASVNVVGASDFRESTNAFKLKAEPRTPSPPKNLTVGEITKVSDENAFITQTPIIKGYFYSYL